MEPDEKHRAVYFIIRMSAIERRRLKSTLGFRVLPAGWSVVTQVRITQHTYTQNVLYNLAGFGMTRLKSHNDHDAGDKSHQDH